MTRVLVTNDDGIAAPGLHVLARAAKDAGHDVTIAAPTVQSSGSSASIMAEDHEGRIAVERRELDGLADVAAFAVHGGPGLIAMIAARGAFGDPADVVLSGVNHGANVGRAILHSGTVGAALTGGLNGAWGMAVSLDVGMRPDQFHWDAAADAAMRLLPGLLASPRATVINVNVPNAASNRGFREATLAPFGIVQTTLTERAEHHIRLAVEDLPKTPAPGTDAACLAQGWVTVTGLDPVSHVPLAFLGLTRITAEQS
ncbi:5'/3'-nucleotidase SurE [Microbacterium ulmi]|uniref:5'-nucleotidase n=1 Tax=Microbacterium ulmi TaxID=179095 RepID=A0A7Y2M0Z9_9MICO|nr:5'/3'-nucleotidase SurE [Microbacterium ulmi]NII69882.1 5'-nucleotidase [Microbacterium ulmi]NNH03804.1 5'/3'-nucleotidase SurE [Microbacterium ulmi]